MATVTLSASEFQERVGEALDRALSQPVLITKHGRPRNVVLSYDEYERLRARDRLAVRAEELTDEDIAALEASEMARGYEHLNAELKAK
ncbi:type II toxin-antitoxin system prevent-host-death family antitoxin [Bradyrhizobium jicamae]|uniref:type II toxin-antitoxin system prevent-host-death family antitoxin n=1 Tax=Bradyrhizobium jicamae TaxID=280332 RepID=UPI001BA4A551|nr:type II toxin-antitoxin system prevent-host-death family antitoxin [Bradyrhizobium jicamae]MBR0758445.1 type II toxin-antitoxin system prevent-host-death family antitoxin [Bradyrhizobium jicamae]